MNGNQTRVARGVRAGGQFSGRTRDEADVHLTALLRSSEAFGEQASIPDDVYLDQVEEMQRRLSA